jgi:hypothetical protein
MQQRSSLHRVDGMPAHAGAFSIYGPGFHLRSVRITSMGVSGRHPHCPGSYYLQMKSESPLGAPLKTLYSGWTNVEAALAHAFNLLAEQGHQMSMTLFVPNGEYQVAGYYILRRDPVAKNIETWFLPEQDSAFACPACVGFSSRRIHLVMEHLLSRHAQDLKDMHISMAPPTKIPVCDLPVSDLERYLWLFFVCNAGS